MKSGRSTKGPGAIAIESTDGRNSVVTMTVPSVSSDEWTDPKLVFDKVENHYVLARIEYGDGEGREIVSRTAETDRDVVTRTATRNDRA
jgi:hypothetical protein